MPDDKKDAERHIAITAANGHCGRAILELLLTNADFKGTYDSVTALHNGTSEEGSELKSMGAHVVDISKAKDLSAVLSKIDTLVCIPPASEDKLKQVQRILKEASKAKNVTNLILLSSAGCDFANRDEQPHIREFIDMEVLAMEPKSDSSTEQTGHSPCIIRAGFFAENLLIYSKHAKDHAVLPLPIDPDHKFAPVALGDVALFIAKIAVSRGEHGLADNVRGQLFVLTGKCSKIMCAGPELAEAASKGLSAKMGFKSISEKEAQKILDAVPDEELDPSEKEYLKEYYSLVRSGKTNYVATAGFEPVTGQEMQGLDEFFKAYQSEFKPKKRRTH